MITADLKGKTALVTGGASGIGLAVVELFARSGATVAVNYLPNDPAGPAQVARLTTSGLKVITAPGDVSAADDAARMTLAAIDKLGHLDMLVNIAGTPGAPQPIDFANLDAMTEPFWERVLSTNLLGPFRCARAAAPALRNSRGVIVNMGSVSGLGIRGSSIAYAASKAALINVTRSLAKALAPEVRVNAVAPGLVDSPWTRGWPEERKRRTTASSMLGRMATPEDIAEGVLYLCAGAAYVTGETLVIDGGQM